MPAGYDEAQAGIWRQLAGRAVRRGMLTADTAFAFDRLVRVVVFRDQMAACIAVDGLTQVKVNTLMGADGSGDQFAETKAHPLITKMQASDRHIDSWLARFGLNATGKPQADAGPPRADPVKALIPMRRVQ
jgi:hypothetical protein